MLSGVKFTFIQAPRAETGAGREIIKKTSGKGRFFIKRMEPGSYSVRVTKKGYSEKQLTVLVDGNERSELVVEMERIENAA